jgi:hypothetical protein
MRPDSFLPDETNTKSRVDITDWSVAPVEQADGDSAITSSRTTNARRGAAERAYTCVV